MNRMRPEGMNYYDQAVSWMIAEKYGYSLMDALRAFTASQTHELLQDRENGLSSFGAEGIFGKASRLREIQETPFISEGNEMQSGANEEMRFFVYLPEYYAYSKGRNAGDVLREWDAHG